MTPIPRRSTAVVRTSRDGVRLALLLAALVLLGSGGAALRPLVAPQGEATAAQDGAGWEARRLVAQLLWAKTHAVIHAGVEERDARPGEAYSRAGEFHAAGGDQEADTGHDHEEGHVLVIPPAREDFRGAIGDLERTLKPYLSASGRMYEKDAAQTIPFYRLMTWADPHFIQGWTVGAAFIGDAGQRADAGLAFLHEGERHNPTSFEIQGELGHFYLVYKRDHGAAERHLRAALRFLPSGKLTDPQQEARVEAYRWLALCYVEAGKRRDAVATATLGRAFAPHDVTFRHVLAYRGRNWTHAEVAGGA